MAGKFDTHASKFAGINKAKTVDFQGSLQVLQKCGWFCLQVDGVACRRRQYLELAVRSSIAFRHGSFGHACIAADATRKKVVVK